MVTAIKNTNHKLKQHGMELSGFGPQKRKRWYNIQKPVLNYGDGFPNEYAPKEKTFKQF